MVLGEDKFEAQQSLLRRVAQLRVVIETENDGKRRTKLRARMLNLEMEISQLAGAYPTVNASKRTNGITRLGKLRRAGHSDRTRRRG